MEGTKPQEVTSNPTPLLAAGRSPATSSQARLRPALPPTPLGGGLPLPPGCGAERAEQSGRGAEPRAGRGRRRPRPGPRDGEQRLSAAQAAEGRGRRLAAPPCREAGVGVGLGVGARKGRGAEPAAHLRRRHLREKPEPEPAERAPSSTKQPTAQSDG